MQPKIFFVVFCTLEIFLIVLGAMAQVPFASHICDVFNPKKHTWCAIIELFQQLVASCISVVLCRMLKKLMIIILQLLKLK